jgi:hypothetical protein
MPLAPSHDTVATVQPADTKSASVAPYLTIPTTAAAIFLLPSTLR